MPRGVYPRDKSKHHHAGYKDIGVHQHRVRQASNVLLAKPPTKGEIAEYKGLIDRTKLLEEMREKDYTVASKYMIMTTEEPYNGKIVTFCRECKYFLTMDGKYRCAWHGIENIDPEFYCARGEKEQEDEDDGEDDV